MYWISSSNTFLVKSNTMLATYSCLPVLLFLSPVSLYRCFQQCALQVCSSRGRVQFPIPLVGPHLVECGRSDGVLVPSLGLKKICRLVSFGTTSSIWYASHDYIAREWETLRTRAVSPVLPAEAQTGERAQPRSRPDLRLQTWPEAGLQLITDTWRKEPSWAQPKSPREK